MKGQAGDRVAGNQAPEDRLGHERAAPCSRTDAELRSFGGARFSPRAAAPRRRSVGEALFDSSRVMPCDVFIPCQPAGMELGISDSCDFACSRPAVRSSGDGPLGSRSSGECIWRRSFFLPEAGPGPAPDVHPGSARRPPSNARIRGSPGFWFASIVCDMLEFGDEQVDRRSGCSALLSEWHGHP